MWLTREGAIKLSEALKEIADGGTIQIEDRQWVHVFNLGGDIYLNGQRIVLGEHEKNAKRSTGYRYVETTGGTSESILLQQMYGTTENPLRFEELLHLENPFSEYREWETFIRDRVSSKKRRKAKIG